MIYTIEADGQQFDIEGPDDATPEELQGAVEAHLSTPSSRRQEDGDILAQAEKALPLPYQAALAAERGVRKVADVAGEKTAEALAGGVSLKSHPLLPPPFNVLPEETPGKGLRTSPETAAAIGTTVQMAPDIAQALLPLGEAKAIAKSTKAGRMLLAPSAKTAGANFGKALAREGVALEGEILDTPRSAKAITEYAEGLHPLTKAKAKQVAEMMEPSQLNKLRTQLGDILDNLNVAKQGKEASKLASKTTIANLSKIKETVTEALQVAKPGLREAFQDVAGAKGRQAAIRTLGNVVKTGAKVAAGGTAAGAALKYLFR